MAGGVGHTGGLTNPRPWHGRCRAGYSHTGGPLLPRTRKKALLFKKYIFLADLWELLARSLLLLEMTL